MMRSVISLVAMTLLLTFALSAVSSTGAPEAAWAVGPAFPDLHAASPYMLEFKTVTFTDGTTHRVLAFSQNVWNGNYGAGPLELRGMAGVDPANSPVPAFQYIYNDDGSCCFATHQVGDFVWHVEHRHWHFQTWVESQLWRLSDYQSFLNGDLTRVYQYKGLKESFCLGDTLRVSEAFGGPQTKVYSDCGTGIQGVSVGWGDFYVNGVYGQWIDLGRSKLGNGNYVLRSIADPYNQLYESLDKGDPSRESATANEGVTCFNNKNGTITITSCSF